MLGWTPARASPTSTSCPSSATRFRLLARPPTRPTPRPSGASWQPRRGIPPAASRRRSGGLARRLALGRRAPLRHAPATGSAAVSSGRPATARQRPTKNSRISSSDRLPARAVPVPDAVVEAEDRAREQAGIGLGDRALLHAAGEEGGPGELEVAHLRARELARLLLARGRAGAGRRATCSATSTRLRITSCSVSSNAALSTACSASAKSSCSATIALELLAIGLHGQRLDLVQAMELGLEVVVERRRPDADRLGDVRPLAVLVSVRPNCSIAVARISSRLLREEAPSRRGRRD